MFFEEDRDAGYAYSLFWRINMYRGLAVDWCLIVQAVEIESAIRHEVVRVDCCHGSIHRHRFSEADPDADRNTPLLDLHRGMHNDVDRVYGEEYDHLVNTWDEYVGRWAL